MGWKRVRDHYRIKHIVRVLDGRICIGSPYVPDLIAIEADGTVRESTLGVSRNADLTRYLTELRAEPDQLRRLIAEPDTFAQSIPVYTYDGGAIIEKQCEAPGWPNVTHDGDLMYDNTFSTSRADIVREARENAAARVKWIKRGIADLERQVANQRAELADACEDVARLEDEADAPAASILSQRNP